MRTRKLGARLVYRIVFLRLDIGGPIFAGQGVVGQTFAWNTKRCRGKAMTHGRSLAWFLGGALATTVAACGSAETPPATSPSTSASTESSPVDAKLRAA